MTDAPRIALRELSWPRVRDAIDRGFDRVVFAVGATEQHGPHLPLLVDDEIGSDLALRVARALGNTLVAPTIPVGCSEHHMRFPGTLSIREETLEALVADYCVSLSRHGFREILIIPSHGGNFAPLASMLPRIEALVKGSASLWLFRDLSSLVGAWRDAVRLQGGPEEHVGGHADIAESSIMMTLAPDLVDPEAAAAGYRNDLSNDAFAAVIRDGLHTVSPNGILGDARGMSPELGQACQAAAARLIVDSFLDRTT